MPQIKEFDAGNVTIRPTEVGVDARAATARRIGMFYNQRAGAVDQLAAETNRLAGQTQNLGRETQQLGNETEREGGIVGQSIANIGRRAASAIDVAGDVAVKALDHQQISHGAQSFAALTERATNAWNETVKNADPNDPTVAKKFMDGLEARLEEFKGDGFFTENAQTWAENHTNALRTHFVEKTSADMATLAGHAAVVNQQQTVNSLSSTVRSDPASLDFSIGTLKSSTEGLIASSPNLSGTQAAQVRSEILQKGMQTIIKSAALGYIEKTGSVPAWATDPKYAPYIDGAELKQLEQASRYYRRLGESEDRAARVQRDYELKTDFNTKMNDLEASTMPRKAGDPPNLPADYWARMRDLATHPGAALEPGRLKTMVENGERITARLNKAEPLGPESHETTVGLINRMRGVGADRMQSSDEIYKAYGEGKLNNSDFTFLMNEWVARKTPQGAALERDRTMFFKNYGEAIGGSAYNPQMGAPAMYAAEMDARRREDAMRKAGKDPSIIYDPSSSEFFGKPENIARFNTSMTQSMRDRLDAASKSLPPAAQRPPGIYPTPQGNLKWTGTGWVKP